MFNKALSRWLQLKHFFIFTPKIGEDFQFFSIIFFRWVAQNHQPEGDASFKIPLKGLGIGNGLTDPQVSRCLTELFAKVMLTW